MKKVHINLLLLLGSLLLMSNPQAAQAASQQKTFTGKVQSIVGSQVFFTTTSAAHYAADVGNAILVRKYGAALQFSEIAVGDKIEVKGTLWSDNSISASYFRDVSLYAHSGTFAGKVQNIDPASGNFTMQSSLAGIQTISTSAYTVFTKNGASASLSDLTPGMSVSVKGMWDRTNTNITAQKVAAMVRLVNIYITGALVMKNGNSLTLSGDNKVIYGITFTSTQLENKKGAALSVNQMVVGDALRVWGKHVSGGVQITASLVKDYSVSK